MQHELKVALLLPVYTCYSALLVDLESLPTTVPPSAKSALSLASYAVMLILDVTLRFPAAYICSMHGICV